MTERVVFHGEVFEFDAPNSTMYLHIKEPFYSAGKTFKWKGESIGFSINREALLFAIRSSIRKIRVRVGDNPRHYEILAKRWLAFSTTTKSIMVKKGVTLYVVQWNETLFKTIYPKGREVKSIGKKSM